MSNFQALGLAQPLVRALEDAAYTDPTPVQSQAIPAALAGADLKVASATGSGKTAAFALPALQRVLEARAARVAQRQATVAPALPAVTDAPVIPMSPDGIAIAPDVVAPAAAQEAAPRRERAPRRNGPPVSAGPRVLVLAPTRELAQQVARATQTYGRHIPGLKVATVVGGVPYAAQLKALRMGVDILIATPGRMLDHFGAGKLDLSSVELFVLDEADRMLDMGFIDDIRHVASQLPQERQTMMFSATFAGAAGHLASEMLKRDAQTIAVASHTTRHDNIEQRLHWADSFAHKHAMLEQLLAEPAIEQALVFTSTQHDADWVADKLAEIGHAVASLHGGMPQGRRNRVLSGLRSRDLRVLVATDVAARGIDVPGISHVINFGLPMKAEDYVHRIGRTGRAGRSGIAITLAERRDIGFIKRIQHFTTQPIAVSVVAGCEPRMPAPDLGPLRRPMPGGFRPNGSAPGGFRPGGPGPKRGFAPRHGQGEFGHAPRHGQGEFAHVPRQGHGHGQSEFVHAPRHGAGDAAHAPRHGHGEFAHAPRHGHCEFQPGPRRGPAGARPTSPSFGAGSNRAGKPAGRAPR